MPAEPPSDDPQLPQLRRFRFGPDDAVPREVTAPDSAPHALAEDDDPGSPDDDPDDRAPFPDLTSTLQATEHLLRRSARGMPADRAVPSPGDPSRLPAEAALRARVPAAVPLTVRRGAAPPARPAILPPADGRSAPRRRRARLPLILTGAAAVAVLALIGWLVLRPADGAPDAAGESRRTSAVPAGQWADGACQALASFESAALPIRAVAVQAAAGTGTPGTDVGNLRREAGTLLENLAARVAALGSPAASSPVAALADDLSDAVDGAIALTGGNANGSVGGPGAAASLVSQALAAPLAAFTESLEGLDEPSRQEVTAISSCAALL